MNHTDTKSVRFCYQLGNQREISTNFRVWCNFSAYTICSPWPINAPWNIFCILLYSMDFTFVALICIVWEVPCFECNFSVNDTALAHRINNKSFPWKQSHTTKSLSQIPTQKDTQKIYWYFIEITICFWVCFDLNWGQSIQSENKSAERKNEQPKSDDK